MLMLTLLLIILDFPSAGLNYLVMPALA